tara:strand:- start:168 stop:326 length:159 start_codon:yes stop_codon:yes gene_type:complete
MSAAFYASVLVTAAVKERSGLTAKVTNAVAQKVVRMKAREQTRFFGILSYLT